jgi:hypothetical protein
VGGVVGGRTGAVGDADGFHDGASGAFVGAGESAPMQVVGPEIGPSTDKLT